jgi:hypothetical protein
MYRIILHCKVGTLPISLSLYLLWIILKTHSVNDPTLSRQALAMSAQLRREVISRLLPKLKISDRCKIDDRFLIVEGKKRTYKIHFGSGNILMEPNNSYLCIVADAAKASRSSEVFLPFEGDGMLSIILSKAFLLAEDDKIKDSSILSQINAF